MRKIVYSKIDSDPEVEDAIAKRVSKLVIYIIMSCHKFITSWLIDWLIDLFIKMIRFEL